jgi:seryl-tRNA synthetase
MFSRDEMQRAIEDALKQMEGVALELYRRGREEARAELAEANARRADLRTALEWANEERDRLREQLAAKHSECPDCAMYAERSGRFAEQADQLMRERDEARAEIARLKQRLQFDPGGSDKIDELEDALMYVRDAAIEAYRRGAEAMREACAECVKRLSHEDGLGMGSQRIEGAIRALPIPEEP